VSTGVCVVYPEPQALSTSDAFRRMHRFVSAGHEPGPVPLLQESARTVIDTRQSIRMTVHRSKTPVRVASPGQSDWSCATVPAGPGKPSDVPPVPAVPSE
jgi:hypothetical protein